MNEPRFQFRLWHFFEATAWIAAVSAIVSQVAPDAVLFFLPYLVTLRLVAWDSWHGEWRNVITYFSLVIIGILFGIAIFGFIYLMGDLDPRDANRTGLPIAILGSWAGSIGAVILRIWKSRDEQSHSLEAGEEEPRRK